jgi:DNA-directed RNA polymerase beta' subunit
VEHHSHIDIDKKIMGIDGINGANFSAGFIEISGNCKDYTIFECPLIDAESVSYNNVCLVYQLYGIEAARDCLFNELKEVMKIGGKYIDPRHLSLICDAMTHTGKLTAVTRNGVSHRTKETVQMASFEKTTDIFIKAGIYGQKDKMVGVSAPTMFGQIAPIGTGAITIDLSIFQDTSNMLSLKEISNIQNQKKECNSIPTIFEYDSDNENFVIPNLESLL